MYILLLLRPLQPGYITTYALILKISKKSVLTYNRGSQTNMKQFQRTSQRTVGFFMKTKP